MERPGPPQHLGPILEASLVLIRFGGEGTWASPWTMDAPCVRGLMPNSWSLSHPQSLGSFLWLPQQDSFEDGAVKGVAGAHNFQAAVSSHTAILIGGNPVVFTDDSNPREAWL